MKRKQPQIPERTLFEEGELMEAAYRWTVETLDSRKNTVTTEGEIYGEIASAGFFTEVLRKSFINLTAGKAIYGKPGVACSGPYTIVRVEITKI